MSTPTRTPNPRTPAAKRHASVRIGPDRCSTLAIMDRLAHARAHHPACADLLDEAMHAIAELRGQLHVARLAHTQARRQAEALALRSPSFFTHPPDKNVPR